MAFQPHIADVTDPNGLRPALKRAVMTLIESERQASTINDYIRALNAFLRWAFEERHLPELILLDYLKQERKLIQTLNEQQVRQLLSWKPRTFAEHRLSALICLLLDTGMRISEALSIRREDVDLDNLLVSLRGKGGKHRALPVSLEMRKVLFRWTQKHSFPPLFPTIHGTDLNLRNLLRDFKWLQKELGISGVRFSPHTLRHTFAVSYLRRGENAFYLKKLLGHSTLEMTDRYVQSLGIEDLKAVHERFWLLSGR
jgi:site-specific recombinase XerD